MTHPETTCVSLCGEDDMKGEEVQVHPGIKHRGCLAHMQTSVHIHTHTHKHTLAIARTHTPAHIRAAQTNVSPKRQVNPFTQPWQLKNKVSPCS